MTTNRTPHEQRGMCKHCDMTLSRQPGAHFWLTAFGDEECTAAPLVDGDPGHHAPTKVLNRPPDPEPTGPMENPPPVPWIPPMPGL